MPLSCESVFRHYRVTRSTYLHLDVEVTVTLLNSLSDDLNGCVKLGNAFCSVKSGRCHDVLGRGNQVDLDGHLFRRLSEPSFERGFHCINAFIPVAGHLNV